MAHRLPQDGAITCAGIDWQPKRVGHARVIGDPRSPAKAKTRREAGAIRGDDLAEANRSRSREKGGTGISRAP
jgi:hypothetical protein